MTKNFAQNVECRANQKNNIQDDSGAGIVYTGRNKLCLLSEAKQACLFISPASVPPAPGPGPPGSSVFYTEQVSANVDSIKTHPEVWQYLRLPWQMWYLPSYPIFFQLNLTRLFRRYNGEKMNNSLHTITNS